MEQGLNHRHTVVRDSMAQWKDPVKARPIWIGPALEQHYHNGRKVTLGGLIHGRTSVAIFTTWVHAFIQETLNHGLSQGKKQVGTRCPHDIKELLLLLPVTGRRS